MKPVFKWIIGILLTLILIFGTALWYLGNHWRPLLNEQIHALVLKSSDSLYRVEYDNLKFNLVTGNASVENFRLIPDTAVYENLKNQQKAPDNLYKLSVQKLSINDFHPKRIYSERKLHIDQILIDQPEVEVMNESKAYNDTVSTKEKKSLHEQISDVLNELRIDRIDLKQVNLTYKNRTTLPERVTNIRNVNIAIEDILVDSLAQRDTNRFYNARAIDFTMDNYQLATPDSLYFLAMEELKFSSDKREILLTGLKLEPRYDEQAFYKKVGLAKERYDLRFDTIRVGDISLFRLLRQQKLYAGMLNIKGAKIDIFKNTAYPKKKPEPKIGKYPHQQLKKLAFVFNIDSLLLDDAHIAYVEYSAKSRKKGQVSFEKTSALFRNVTNDSLLLSRNPYMTADVSSRFMDNGNLKVHFSFDLLDKLGPFTYKGSLTNMDARSLNLLTRPLAMVEVKSGNFRSLNFDVRADEYRARGMVRFYYNNLQIRLLQQEEDGTVNQQGMASRLANTFLINDSNPDANEVFHAGPINYRREPTASFFNFFWKSIVEGVKPSVGVSKEREAKLKNVATGAQNTVKGVKGFLKGVFKKKEDKNEKD